MFTCYLCNYLVCLPVQTTLYVHLFKLLCMKTFIHFLQLNLVIVGLTWDLAIRQSSFVIVGITWVLAIRQRSFVIVGIKWVWAIRQSSAVILE